MRTCYAHLGPILLELGRTIDIYMYVEGCIISVFWVYVYISSSGLMTHVNYHISLTQNSVSSLYWMITIILYKGIQGA